jgi:hypothetical protein
VRTSDSYFFYSVDLSGAGPDPIANEAAQQALSTDDPNHALLILDDRVLRVLGFIETSAAGKAAEHARAVAGGIATKLGTTLSHKAMILRDPPGHLDSINEGVEPAYRLPYLNLAHVLEFTAAAEARRSESKEARLYRSAPPPTGAH